MHIAAVFSDSRAVKYWNTTFGERCRRVKIHRVRAGSMLARSLAQFVCTYAAYTWITSTAGWNIYNSKTHLGNRKRGEKRNIEQQQHHLGHLCCAAEKSQIISFWCNEMKPHFHAHAVLFSLFRKYIYISIPRFDNARGQHSSMSMQSRLLLHNFSCECRRHRAAFKLHTGIVKNIFEVCLHNFFLQHDKWYANKIRISDMQTKDAKSPEKKKSTRRIERDWKMVIFR